MTTIHTISKPPILTWVILLYSVLGILGVVLFVITQKPPNIPISEILFDYGNIFPLLYFAAALLLVRLKKLALLFFVAHLVLTSLNKIFVFFLKSYPPDISFFLGSAITILIIFYCVRLMKKNILR